MTELCQDHHAARRRHRLVPTALAALCAIAWSAAPTIVGAEMVRGLEPVEENLPWFDDRERYEVYGLRRSAEEDPLKHVRQGVTTNVVAVTNVGQPPMPDAMRLMLSRSIYPAEDRHLDAVLWLDTSRTWTRGSGDYAPVGELSVQMRDAEGALIDEDTIAPIPARQLYFSSDFTDELLGSEGHLRVEWRDDDGELIGEAERSFSVREPADVQRSGRVRLTIPNEPEASMDGLPVTVGVPFPRGALESTAHLRLVDGEGSEVPVQVKPTARWSRFGSIRWVLCDFVVDLTEREQAYYLEFGPGVRRERLDPLTVEPRDGFPRVDLGALELGDGLSFTAGSRGTAQRLLTERALAGGFVEQARDYDFSGFAYTRMRLRYGFADLPEQYLTPVRTAYHVEEAGPVKLVLRREGWYRKPDSEDEFNKYVIRYVMHRGSPLVRIFHTWIFTGDSNRERISNMGWRMPLAEGLRPKGFLASFDDDAAEWIEANYLLQHRHDAYEAMMEELHRQRDPQRVAEGRRAPGVMAAESDDARLYLGVKDFWRNYPGELEFENDGRHMTFHLWPRHGRAREHATRVEDAFRLWFAHEGEVMDLRLPRELTEGEMFRTASRVESNWAFATPESINAQGIAKTTEMWLYATEADAPVDEAVTVLEGLDQETLRAVVDPEWMTHSGVYYEMHPHDPENYPQEEESYRLQALSIPAQVERMGVYGMWIYGELLRGPDLDAQEAPGLYRIFRKGHWAWPYRWIPFARSGDLDYYKFAEAATRMMSDIAFVHYVGEDVREQFADMPPRMAGWRRQPHRNIGWHNRNLIPWAGFWGPTTREYADEADYLWDAWFLSGYHRGRDVALAWAEATKRRHADGRDWLFWGHVGRPAINAQRQYVLMYKNTFDPWFIAAAHAIAELTTHRYEEDRYTGHPWDSGPRDFQRYTGDSEHREFYLHYARHNADWHAGGWATTPSTLIESSAFAWHLTGEEIFLRRALGLLDLYNWSTYRGGPEYHTGTTIRRGVHDHTKEAGWYLKWFPHLLEVKHTAKQELDELPPPLPLRFTQGGARDIVFHVRKESGSESLPVRGADEVRNDRGEVIELVDGAIPADAAPGTYHVSVNSGSVTIPLTPPGTKEVMELDGGRVGTGGQHYVQHWFMVPEGLETFEIEFENREPPIPGYQITIWNPDGERAWEHRTLARDHDPDQRIVARVEVSTEHAGRLWRITNPGRRSGVPGFQLDEQLPPMVTHSPDRWFDILD